MALLLPHPQLALPSALLHAVVAPPRTLVAPSVSSGAVAPARLLRQPAGFGRAKTRPQLRAGSARIAPLARLRTCCGCATLLGLCTTLRRCGSSPIPPTPRIGSARSFLAPRLRLHELLQARPCPPPPTSSREADSLMPPPRSLAAGDLNSNGKSAPRASSAGSLWPSSTPASCAPTATTRLAWPTGLLRRLKLARRRAPRVLLQPRALLICARRAGPSLPRRLLHSATTCDVRAFARVGFATLPQAPPRLASDGASRAHPRAGCSPSPALPTAPTPGSLPRRLPAMSPGRLLALRRLPPACRLAKAGSGPYACPRGLDRLRLPASTPCSLARKPAPQPGPPPRATPAGCARGRLLRRRLPAPSRVAPALSARPTSPAPGRPVGAPLCSALAASRPRVADSPLGRLCMRPPAARLGSAPRRLLRADRAACPMVLTEKNNMLSLELEKCQTQLAVVTAKLEKSKEAPPVSVDQLQEELKVAQAGKQQAERQLAAGERVLTQVRDDKNKLQDSNTLLGEELKDVRAQLADAVKGNRRLQGGIFSMLTGRPEEEVSGSQGDLLQELSQVHEWARKAMRSVAKALWPSVSPPGSMGELVKLF
nr:proline-rich protein 36-like [Aegilops tauschii subsp. strangulata]